MEEWNPQASFFPVWSTMALPKEATYKLPQISCAWIRAWKSHLPSFLYYPLHRSLHYSTIALSWEGRYRSIRLYGNSTLAWWSHLLPHKMHLKHFRNQLIERQCVQLQLQESHWTKIADQVLYPNQIFKRENSVYPKIFQWLDRCIFLYVSEPQPAFS